MVQHSDDRYNIIVLKPFSTKNSSVVHSMTNCNPNR